MLDRGWNMTSQFITQWPQNLLRLDRLQVKPAFDVHELYLYHPPFYFYLLSKWLSIFGDTPGAARVLAATMSIALCILTYVLVRTQINSVAGLVALILIASDGWIVYTNRTAIIENTMLPIALVGLLVYQYAFYTEQNGRRRLLLYLLSGAIVAFAGVFKHTGLYILAVFPIHWIITRRHTAEHFMAMVAAGLVIFVYLTGMIVIFQGEFVRALLVQIERTTGGYSSRGVVSISDVIAAAFSTYSIFAGTILTSALSAIILARKFWRVLRQRNLSSLRGPTSLYLAWTVAALIFFAAINLKFPQYFIMIFLPLYCFLASELALNFSWQGMGQQRLISALLTLIICLNVTTFVLRFGLHNDNAIGEIAVYASQDVRETLSSWLMNPSDRLSHSPI